MFNQVMAFDSGVYFFDIQCIMLIPDTRRHCRESKQMGFHYRALTARSVARRCIRNERHAFILRVARRGGSKKSPREPITGDISNLIMHNLFPSFGGVLHSVCTLSVYSILVSSCQGLYVERTGGWKWKQINSLQTVWDNRCFAPLCAHVVPYTMSTK